jgi:vacuolar-type H+-ATPase subunit C/Vma6
MSGYGPQNARARGLAAHLPGRAALERLAEAPDRPALRRGLPEADADIGAAIDDAGPPPVSVDRSVQRAASARLGLLVRWAPSRPQALRVVLEEEDRRSVQALLRGAAQGAPPEDRIAGLVPTNALPVSLLATLAEADSPEDLVRRLADQGHPTGLALRALFGERPVDLYEAALQAGRVFAERAARAVRRGDRHLKRYLSRAIDLENAWAALLSGEQAALAEPGSAFLPGGRGLKHDLFAEVLAESDPNRRRSLLARAFRRTRIEGVFLDRGLAIHELERAVLTALIAEERDARRLDPLGPAPLLETLLRIRAEAVDLRRIAWGVDLGAPAALIATGLATPR